MMCNCGDCESCEYNRPKYAVGQVWSTRTNYKYEILAIYNLFYWVINRDSSMSRPQVLNESDVNSIFFKLEPKKTKITVSLYKNKATGKRSVSVSLSEEYRHHSVGSIFDIISITEVEIEDQS